MIKEANKQNCHNYQTNNCSHSDKDCASCDDWWYEEADENIQAWRGR